MTVSPRSIGTERVQLAGQQFNLCKSSFLQATFSNLVSKKLPSPPGPLSWNDFGEVFCSIATDILEGQRGTRQKSTAEVLALVEEICKLEGNRRMRHILPHETSGDN